MQTRKRTAPPLGFIAGRCRKGDGCAQGPHLSALALLQQLVGHVGKLCVNRTTPVCARDATPAAPCGVFNGRRHRIVQGARGVNATCAAPLAVTCLRCAVRRERRGTDDTARCCCACTALPAESRAAAAIRGGGAGGGRRAPGGRSQGAGFRAFGLGLAKRPARRRCHQVAHGAQCVAVAAVGGVDAMVCTPRVMSS